ncbi:MAG TPA: alpha/beta hydrolase fold domain-containing protein [Steroidobacteraceae bacterium]|nr:alpha/beta hydrolase fold domain-containing protein [Steroidobacteraceae bacterium]
MHIMSLNPRRFARFRTVVMTLLAGFTMGGAPAQQPPRPPNPIVVDADGTVHVPAQAVPVSEFLSPEGKAYLREHLQQVQRPEMLVQKDGVPPLLAGYLARQRQMYAVDREDTHIAGVHAFVYTPKAGITGRNSHRVLIDLHGGGFSGCWPGCAELESIPVAALARIRVISLDYRESPEYHFPAASEDVASVYQELLKTYDARSIGIYGCSAGGMLTGESVAWILQHKLPRPGAIAILCAGLTAPEAAFGGDANYITTAIGEARSMTPPPTAPRASGAKAPDMSYFAGADMHDPLLAPARSPKLLARFPPSLIVTGTRGFELSSAVYSHSLLVKAGAQSDLHVWEGMFHGFFYNVDVPESRDCFNVIVHFFDSKLK